jgi:protein-S-isoprenylcysteine O-methyltransferase Ste14
LIHAGRSYIFLLEHESGDTEMKTVYEIAGNAIIGFAIFIVLPLIAWGLDDLSGFFDHDSRAGYVAVIIFLQLFQLTHLPKVPSESPSRDMSTGRQQTVILLLRLIPLAIVLVAPYYDRRNLYVMEVAPWVRNCGLVLFSFGMIIMPWAELSVGRLFCIQGAIQREYWFRTDGIYWHLRRPMDLGALMVALGVSVAFRSWLGLILGCVMLIVVLWCIRDEESRMRERFGEDWKCYSERTWRLIPFVY